MYHNLEQVKEIYQKQSWEALNMPDSSETSSITASWDCVSFKVCSVPGTSVHVQ